MKKKLTAVVLVLILALIFVAGYIRINREYPAASIQRSEAGQEAEIQDGIFITVTGSEILTDEERNMLYEKRGETPFLESKIWKVNVTLENRTNEVQHCDMTSLNLETKGDSAGISSFLGSADMGKFGSVMPELEPGEKIETAYAFEILAYRYTARQWEQIGSREFWLTFSSYPVKSILEL